jgi:hypothetical protein
MYSMDYTACTEEQTSLEHSMSEQVEHTSHKTKLCVIVEYTVMTRQ